ncbi:cohesin domain-containing protein [Lacimicrobium alkaliphilum]|uniref:PEP-CTERM protein-sorting domain-containing protein n=1 Tax=Lacimicrobium alkaliphilum TaxID=1526571 RepID=A0ABQ1RBG6_9ALTE|nr:cohesin domain-containing protein [Lacimicrobium alkaliphilum]GGD63065.1 hypothetical protein GCM10011357_17930 [Lacimicrobium alkaliphilum]
MKKLFRNLCVAIALGIPGMAIATPIISVNPDYTNGTVGDVISVDILWDGSADPEYLGAWDIDLSFDNSILSFTSATFGFGVDSLGCIAFFTCDAFESSPGIIDLFEESLDSVADLMANQDGLANQFVLASLTFDAIGNGGTALAFTGSTLTFGDASGAAISPNLINGFVCIGEDGCVTVPEPTAILLLLSGLVLLRRFRKR